MMARSRLPSIRGLLAAMVLTAGIVLSMSSLVFASVYGSGNYGSCEYGSCYQASANQGTTSPSSSTNDTTAADTTSASPASGSSSSTQVAAPTAAGSIVTHTDMTAVWLYGVLALVAIGLFVWLLLKRREHSQSTPPQDPPIIPRYH